MHGGPGLGALLHCLAYAQLNQLFLQRGESGGAVGAGAEGKFAIRRAAGQLPALEGEFAQARVWRLPVLGADGPQRAHTFPYIVAGPGALGVGEDMARLAFAGGHGGYGLRCPR